MLTKNKEQGLHKIVPYWDIDLGLLRFINVRIKFLLFISYSVFGYSSPNSLKKSRDSWDYMSANGWLNQFKLNQVVIQ